MMNKRLLLFATQLIACCVVIGACRLEQGSNKDPMSELARDVCGNSRTSPIAHTFFVETFGNDLADGSIRYPFKSIGRAQQAVRNAAYTMDGDIEIRIGPGEYFLPAPLQFDESDSGRKGFDVIYRAADPNRATRIIAGARIDNWESFSGEILRAKVDAEAQITTLFEDGLRVDEARYPDRKEELPWRISRSEYLTADNSTPSPTTLEIGAQDLPGLSENIKGARVFVWPGHDWYTDVISVATVDVRDRKLILASEARYPITKGSRYFLLGALQFLSRPGEFFHDTESGFLYYWPRSKSPDREVIVPLYKSALLVQGSSKKNSVSNLRFEDLTFEASTFPSSYRFGWPRAGQSGESHLVPAFDRQIEMPDNRFGLVTLENTRRVQLRNLHLKNAGLSGVYMLFSNRENCVYGNLIEHSGINGIALQGSYPGEGDVLLDNVLSNNWIRNVGEMAGNAAGVDISDAGFNEVSYSLIQNSPRFGVIWHAGVVVGIPSYVNGNVFKYLRIENVGADSGDMGAVYSFGLNADFPTTTRVNLAEQIIVSTVSADPSMKDLTPHGVFMDNDSPGQILRNIRVEKVDGLPFFQNSGSHQFENVSWLQGFDVNLIEESRIGLRFDFPSRFLR